MADPKGFLTTPRQEAPRRPVEERVRDWDEVYVPGGLLPIISGQADRCMDCGVPFCHDACPLGNLIPEWNDLVARGDWRAASERLHATNNFPEFTGRLCPAPCEAGCVLAIDPANRALPPGLETARAADPAPVTIKNVELAIADRAWQDGSVTPRPPERLTGRTVAVVGSGPAGLAAAQQLTRAGHTVAVYERDDRPGGLLRYGIPAFKMERRHLDRRLEQLTGEGVRFRTSTEVGQDVSAADLRARYDAVVLAIGATAWRDLDVPGRELAGIHQAMEYLPLADRVCQGDLAVSPLDASGKHVVIVGGGDTGADCLGTAVRQRAASVTQLDIYAMPDERRREEVDPWPTYPKVYRLSAAHEEAGALGTAPAADADARLFAASTLRFTGDAEGHVRQLHLVEVDDARRPRPGTERALPADLVLIALGFHGPERTPGGLVEQLGLGATARGIARDAAFGTDVPGVFVAGDAGRGQSLVVWAIAEGRSAAASVDRWLTGSTRLPAPVRAHDRPMSV
ncbi:glutamate synthase subunit beta [Streptomyces beihaiensis]|uniref:Glutamate synthase subunit beta n=1 Tax=Streptomyces beihaiensis TaxID=2984495 RepID=A0ABT3TT73_9ACTN|nr:glutamate synthase subunit beta [Streptomyces beihaiensis]MCX3060245.1 glutamate synthase subunit beta [Streptomyces beihaiensis]